MGYLEFLEAEFGKKWVVARRSESIVRQSRPAGKPGLDSRLFLA